MRLMCGQRRLLDHTERLARGISWWEVRVRKSLGVDVGLSGAAAILIEIDGAVTVVSAIDIPIIGGGAARRVNVLALQEWLLSHGPAFAFCERAQSMPRQGV